MRRRNSRATASAIVASAAAFTLTAVVCASVLRLESLWPLRFVPRMDVVPAPFGTWGASWEPLSQGPDAIQREALIALVRTVQQLGAASLLIATLSLTLHAVSRILGAWRSLAIRCALGAPLRSLLALVGRDFAMLAGAGCAAGALGGAAIVAALDATWPVLLTRPPHVLAALLAAALSLVIVLVLLLGIALLLLAALQRGIAPTVSQLHGEHVTPSGPLILAQSAAAVLQLAALLVVTYGAVLFLRNSTLFEPPNAVAQADAAGVAPLTWSGPAVESTRVRAHGVARFDSAVERRHTMRADLTSSGAKLGLGRRIPVMAFCGVCFIGPRLIPMTSATLRMIAVNPRPATGPQRYASRELAPSDSLGAPLVAVLNEAAAYELYPGAIAIGKTFQASFETGGTYAVVGIRRTASPRGLGNRGNEPLIAWVSALQHPPTIAEVSAPRTVWDSILAWTSAAADASRIQPSIGAVRSLADQLAEFAAPLNWFGGLCIGLAVTATGIASWSLAAVMNQIISIRERDIAIRVALGASPRDVERWVSHQTLGIVVTGVMLGLSVARWVGVVLREKPTQSAEGDIALLAAMVLAFGALGIVASWLPARRAARIEPAAIWGAAPGRRVPRAKSARSAK